MNITKFILFLIAFVLSVNEGYRSWTLYRTSMNVMHVQTWDMLESVQQHQIAALQTNYPEGLTDELFFQRGVQFETDQHFIMDIRRSQSTTPLRLTGEFAGFTEDGAPMGKARRDIIDDHVRSVPVFRVSQLVQIDGRRYAAYSKQDVAEVFGTNAKLINSHYWQMGSSALFSLYIIGFFIWWMGRHRFIDDEDEPVSQPEIRSQVTADLRLAHAALHSLREGICIADEAGVAIFVNERMCDLSGYKEGEIVGKQVEMFLPPGLHATHIGYRVKYREDPKQLVYREVTFLGKEGIKVTAWLGVTQTDPIRGVRYDVAMLREEIRDNA